MNLARQELNGLGIQMGQTRSNTGWLFEKGNLFERRSTREAWNVRELRRPYPNRTFEL